MGKNKILSSILAGLSLCLFMGSTTSAIEGNSSVVSPSYFNYDSISNLNNFEKVDILDSKYDLSGVNPAVIQALVRSFDSINSGNLSGEEKNKKLSDMKEFIEDYLKDPSKFENFPVTLDLGPTTLFREEIMFVQEQIGKLKDEQKAIKDTKMAQTSIDEKVKELQTEIDNLSKWINYSVYNFQSDNYKQTFTNSSKIEVNNENEEEVYTLLTHVYSTPDYNELFKVSVNSDGKFVSDKEIIGDLIEVVKKNLEFENLKVRKLLEKVEMIKNSKIAQIEMDKQIKEVKMEIESVKAYGLSQEIILLNLEKDSVSRLRISQELIQERIKNIDDKINENVNDLKKFKENSENNKEYVLENSNFGKTPSYFGYVLQDGDKFGIKVSLDDKNNISIDNIVVADKDKVTIDILTQEQKDTMKKVINEDILKFKNEISKLQSTKTDLEAKNADTKYYFVDSINKELSVLDNNIKNYEMMLSKF